MGGTARLRLPLAPVTEEILACRICADALPHEPRPVLRVDAHARILIVGQAPGSKVHESGVPWQDASGDHLLEWLGVDRPTFEDARNFAIVPMGFCWPGRRSGGDLPPRPECAPRWHPPLLSALPHIELELLVGSYAQQHYLPELARRTATERIRDWRSHLPRRFLLPHPSWRSRRWMTQHPWFEAQLLPELRRRVASVVNAPHR